MNSPNMDHETGAATADQITRCFREIEATRMAGIPILNPALSVEVVGLREFCGEWLCILITPWFMNVMLLPAIDRAADPMPAATGTKQIVSLPAGRFEMICGFEPLLGHYRMCSLFSPVLEFADQASAVAAAEAALEELVASERDSCTEDDAEMAMIWRGERPERIQRSEAMTVGAEQPANDPEVIAPVTGRQPLSRRGLLFGTNEREKA